MSQIKVDEITDEAGTGAPEITDHYKKSNILGTVSESGGVPTGAVIESGSNSNGEFVKFADGTQICHLTENVTDQSISFSYNSLYQSTRSILYPVNFISEPSVSFMAQWGTSASWASISDIGTSGTTVRFIDGEPRSSGTSTLISLTAIGRWY